MLGMEEGVEEGSGLTLGHRERERRMQILAQLSKSQIAQQMDFFEKKVFTKHAVQLATMR
jgi:hypothetical protein